MVLSETELATRAPGRDDDRTFLAQAREVRLALGNRALVVHEGSRPIAFAALDLGDDETELAALYGFRPVLTRTEFLRLPGVTPAT